MLRENQIHPSWQDIIQKSLAKMDQIYLQALQNDSTWLPGPKHYLNAFSLPLENVQYILFGESPYPRPESANGYAFWDAAVDTLWSDTGFSKAVNRATSLRNFLKMLLVARGDLSSSDLTQNAINKVNKDSLCQNLTEVFSNLTQQGFLLLNSSLVLSNKPVKQEAKYWLPFMSSVLHELSNIKNAIQLVLFGNIAKTIQNMAAATPFQQFIAEHPYNLSFIHNENVIGFFQPFDLLRKHNDEQ